MMSFKVLSLLLVSLGFVLMEENVSGVSIRIPSARPVQRRYSEATLASDYSRAMDNMLKKNFVEWLLARREKKSDNIIEPFKRETESQTPVADGQESDLDMQEGKDFFTWLLKAKKNPSFAFPEGSEGLKDVLNPEFLAWLMSIDVCKPATELFMLTAKAGTGTERDELAMDQRLCEPGPCPGAPSPPRPPHEEEENRVPCPLRSLRLVSGRCPQ
ncbi:gastric inhibitory polypeptide [Porphyrio hochstetteri]